MGRPSRLRLAARHREGRASAFTGRARRAGATLAAVALAVVPSVPRPTAAQPVQSTQAPAPPTSNHADARASLAASAPDPALEPAQVVAIVLDALAHNDEPSRDRGVAVTFAFASPSNRAVLGSVDRLADMVRQDTYRPLLYHRRAEGAPVKRDGEKATQRVVVTTLDGELVAYTFTLSRQSEGVFRGCWMTDGVTRDPRSRARALSLAAAPAGRGAASPAR